MQIILKCEHAYGEVAFNAEFIEGLPAPQRRYRIHEHTVVLDNGLAEPILHHDAEELLKNPLYRLPTPAEQEAMAKEHEQALTAQEQEEYQELTEEFEEQSPDAPPAQQKRKYVRKAS